MNAIQNTAAELVLSPEGHLYLDSTSQADEQLPEHIFEKIQLLFAHKPCAGLLHLGIQEFSVEFSSSFTFWQSFSRQFISHVCKLTQHVENTELPNITAPQNEELQNVIDHAPFMRGVEYLTVEALKSIWNGMTDILRKELQNFSGNLQGYLNQYNPRWNLVGRICFHLAENKNNDEKPFAFLATYTTQLSQAATTQHLPLKRALQDYAGEKNHSALLALLLPVQKASDQCPFIKDLVDTGSIFQPLYWTAKETHRFLKEIPLMESSGITVRVPNWWNPQKPPRPQVVVKLGDNTKGQLGLDTLLDFDMHLALAEGVTLTQEELLSLQDSSSNLVKIKGQWVEIDRAKLESVLTHWNKIQRSAKNGLSMAESLRLLAGSGSNFTNNSSVIESESVVEWSKVVAGDWLKTILDQLRNPQHTPEKSIEKILKEHLHGVLRPYQLAGVQWLWLLYQLKLGGCLADDMGLGKTIQILSLMLIIKQHPSEKKSIKKPHLLVVPASLIGNWQTEVAKFAPSLKILVAHSSVHGREFLSSITPEQLNSFDIVMTTYAFIPRLAWLKDIEWNLLILDEAQLIKNPGTKQTTAVKALKSQVRLTLTGTPIENRLGDLWSLFDFTSPGLLGTQKAFAAYTKNTNKENAPSHHAHFISTLRGLTQPYILRRLKSDKKIITDLPDKTEVQAFCSLSKEQVRLYQQALQELDEWLKNSEGIQRRGLVLAYLMRLKQICNHPSQLLGYGEYAKESSGKFIRLQEICEEIAAKQEKVLVFTQFKEIIPAISSLLTQVFKREGLILHGDTAIKKRPELVAKFQQEQGPPFFVLSLKAGGTGLNLTRASHVIHFDRWWNPAVENQATDRAYRIGQKHPVLVHKFICRGTIEEKIDQLITSKKNLSNEMLENGSEVLLTELSNDELLDLLSLDIQRAFNEF